MLKQKHPKLRVAISGLLTGIVNGFFGAGGGMILVPLLTGYCKLEDKKAFASSVCIVLLICAVTVFSLWKQDLLILRGALPYMIGGAVGGVISGLTFRKVSARFLHLALGILILWGGVKLIFS